MSPNTLKTYCGKFEHIKIKIDQFCKQNLKFFRFFFLDLAGQRPAIGRPLAGQWPDKFLSRLRKPGRPMAGQVENIFFRKKLKM